MLILPTARLIREFANLRDPLPEILADTIETYHRLREQRGYRFRSLRVTSIYRTPAEDRALRASGIHSQKPHRAIDLAMTWEWVRIVGPVINRRWVYSPNRPRLRVFVTKKHGSGAHAHLQVAPETISREELQMGLQV